LHSPITKADPADKYWGVDASFRYGGASVILDTTAGVIDTITELILITTGKLICNSDPYPNMYGFISLSPALDAYNRYVSATGAVLDKGTGLLSITSAQYGNLQSLFFDIGGTTYEITPNAQIFPRAWNDAIGGTSDGIYLIVQDISYSRVSGVDFILGRPFLERFYTVLDSGKSSVGFATTKFTEADTN
jgi:cathepsin E